MNLPSNRNRNRNVIPADQLQNIAQPHAPPIQQPLPNPAAGANPNPQQFQNRVRPPANPNRGAVPDGHSPSR